jgi:dTDP-4-amino-4,6-dideoxygalactose transaminase
MKLPSDADHTGRDLGEEELELLRQVIASGTLNSTKGWAVSRLEREFAERHGVPFCRAASSGTAAIHAAVAAVDPEPGDEIITTPITDMGAITPILYQGAIPVFADVDPLTYNVTAETIEPRITHRTRAIVVTHLFGNPCEMAPIRELAGRYGLPVIEDAAQAYLAESDGRLVGTIGQFGCFSLQQGKHMTCGEGGLVLTSDHHYARRVRLFVDKAWGYGDPQPDHYFLALNYRMTELQGAVAIAQLRKLDGVVRRRIESADLMTGLLQGIPGVSPPKITTGGKHVYWKYPLRVDESVIEGGVEAMGAELKRRGIWCAPRYIQKPAFQCQVLREQCTFGRSRFPFVGSRPEGGPAHEYRSEEYPGTFDALSRVLVLPWNEFYTEEHVSYIAESIRTVAGSLARVHHR